MGEPIYYKTDKRAASASRATKAGREGGYGAPAPWLRSSAVCLYVYSFVRTVLQGIEFSVGSEIEGMESPSEEKRA